MIEGPAILLLVLGGFAYMVGAREFASRAITLGIAFAIVVPLVAVVGAQLVAELGSATRGTRIPALGVLLIIAALFLAVVVAGVVRFVDRRRQLRRWWGEQPTSRKRREET